MVPINICKDHANTVCYDAKPYVLGVRSD